MVTDICHILISEYTLRELRAISNFTCSLIVCNCRSVTLWTVILYAVYSVYICVCSSVHTNHLAIPTVKHSTYGASLFSLRVQCLEYIAGLSERSDSLWSGFKRYLKHALFASANLDAAGY